MDFGPFGVCIYIRQMVDSVPFGVYIVVDKINDTPLRSAGGEGKTEKQTGAGDR